jgi:hypothetical protein
MYDKLLITFLMLFTGLCIKGLQAQEAISAAGDEASGSGGSVSYTVGQVNYSMYSTGNGSLAEGVQQPYEIYPETGLDYARGIELNFSSYPNPVADALTLEIKDYPYQHLMYRLYDMNGHLLESREISGNITTISVGNLAPGSYLLKVLQKSGVLLQPKQASFSNEIKTFKIIKH